MKKLLFTVILIATSKLSLSQMTEYQVRQMVKTATEDELLLQSSQMLQQNYFFHAEIVVDALLGLKPESSNYNYRKGFIVLDARQDYITALPYLEIAIKNTDKNYDNYSSKELSAPLDAYYHLARCYHLNMDLDKAQENFRKFLELSSKKSELNTRAELYIKQCEIAKILISNPKKATVKNIGPVVNTVDPEYAPVISLDGTSLYFTSRRGWSNGESDIYMDPKINQYPEDIYVSYLDFDEGWTSPEKLDFCDSELNEATIAVSSDERKIYVYKDETGAGDIYYSDFKRNAFEQLIELGYDEVNSEYWETHCTMTPDGLNLYFVSDRPGGFGGRDIYRIVKLPSGEWSKPQNMGPTINTPYDEDSPFIAVNNKTLYFSSNGESSMGGFDVFVSFRDAENNWSTPVNLGYPINSTGDDVFYTTTVDGLKGYLSSFRKDGKGEKDIYEIQNDYLGNKPISVLRGKFSTDQGKTIPEGFKAILSCLNCDAESAKNVELRIKKDKFFSLLNRCKDYEIQYYTPDNKLIYTESFSTLCDDENEEIHKDIYIGEYGLEGTVADLKTAEYLKDAKVELVNKIDNSVIASLTTDEKGYFTSDFLGDKNPGDKISLELRISKGDYIAQTFQFDTLLGKFGVIHLDYLLAKMEIGSDLAKTFELNPIYFDLDKSNIRPDAALELDKIVKIMNENPTLVIELGSHTDCRATKAYNAKLSDRRAKSSAAYIKARISNPRRIYGKGYGESQLVNNCACEGEGESECSEEDHQANRRTEFKIVKR